MEVTLPESEKQTSEDNNPSIHRQIMMNRETRGHHSEGSMRNDSSSVINRAPLSRCRAYLICTNTDQKPLVGGSLIVSKEASGGHFGNR
ncbi:hypothetical protein AVEN_8564-1 [Araneus ventricosus]|uniref:Uncharacterized protein n=1 Tax=Araneus ventricosus TaxID=182803 RepID=A0A4Y2GP06_ARAVE|nr:hypothetical protein AVEN_8564-1 [Araneus ventricosus]